MSLEWRNINVEVINKNTSVKKKYLDIIKNCSGEVKHGEILAIMGPSGGGKTTLLNALAGRIPKGSYTQGEIIYNNRSRKKDEWLKMAGFVDQDDIVHEDLSVYETLMYAANFRLLNHKKEKYVKHDSGLNKNTNFESTILNDFGSEPSNVSLDYLIEKKIEKIILDLKLTNCARNQMGKISGGERKRVMIGIELITDPNVIFLDEPTSGLDTLTALKICRILEDLAKNHGKIVILTIHQPSNEIFNIFDRVLLLSHGNTIFNGKTSEVEPFFSNVGIFKREHITYPEFIVEICSEDFKEENPQFFYTEKSIFQENEIFKDPSIRKNKNDFYIDCDLNIRHVKLLLKRKAKIEWCKKWKFLKAILCKLATFLFSCFFNYYMYSMMTKNPMALLGIDDKMMSLLVKSKMNISIEDMKNSAKPIAKGMITISLLMMTTMLYVSSSISSFFHENKLVRREISVGSYSTPSYLISLLVYQIGTELICPLIAVFYYIFVVPDLVDIHFIAVLLLTPFFTVPFGLFVGSISVTKQIVIILSSIFASIASIPPNTISMVGMKYGIIPDSQKLNLLGKFTWLCIFIPTFHYTGFMTYLVYRKGYNLIQSIPSMAIFTDKIKDLMISQKNYIGLKEMHIVTLFTIMILSPIFYLILAVYFLGLNLMPDIRMDLEVDKVKKIK